MHMLLFAGFALLLGSLASPAAGQYRAHSPWQIGAESTHDGHLRAPLAAQERKPPLNAGTVSLQILSGFGGGLVGGIVAYLPFAAREFGGQGEPDDAGLIAMALGFIGGSAAGVQLSSRIMGMKGSWAATLGGAAVGILGGPFLFFTMPAGATVGFNSTRTYLDTPGPEYP